MELSTFRRILWAVAQIAILNFHKVDSLNSTLYPREFADISCSLSANEEGVCVYAYLCHDGVVNVDGTGLVDLRFGDVCEDYFLRCCSKSTPCADNKGKCVPKGSCGANLNQPKYKAFKESEDCSWSGYTCCPKVDQPAITAKPTAKPTKPARPARLPTTPASNSDKSECVCVPDNECENIHGVGLIVERSQPCDTNGHVCCPLDAMKQPVGSPRPDEQEKCDGEKGVCMPGNECKTNPHGVGLIQERTSSQCSSVDHICCPLKTVEPSDCDEVGGQCVPGAQCKKQAVLDIRSVDPSCTKKGHVCCTELKDVTVSENFEGKACFNNMGTCTKPERCNGSKYRDRRNDCNGLVCCGVQTATTESVIPPSPRPTRRSSTWGKTCSAGEGKCTSEENCGHQILHDDEGVCEDLVCCADVPPQEESCEHANGTCLPDSECSRAHRNGFEEECGSNVCCLEPVYRSKGCGYRNDQGVIFKTVNGADGESQYGEFPWVVAIFSEMFENEPKFICAGSLIDPEVVLTTADCVKAFRSRPEKLTIRAGEWDMRSSYEPISHQERGVVSVITHPAFKQSSLVSNVALLFLDDKFDLSHTIDTVCLPPQSFTIYNGDVTATGWGITPTNITNKQQILKSLELPFNQRSDCERTLRRVMRKPGFKLDESFLCAGGYPDVDTCRGDAGSPIVFPVPDDFDSRMYAVGMVSWGVGCGRPGVPAVYTDTGRFRDWIDAELRKKQLQMYYYDYQPNREE